MLSLNFWLKSKINVFRLPKTTDKPEMPLLKSNRSNQPRFAIQINEVRQSGFAIGRRLNLAAGYPRGLPIAVGSDFTMSRAML